MFGGFFSPCFLLGTQNQYREYKIDGYFGERLWKDFKTVSTSPLRWKNKDFLTFSLVLGSGAFLYAFDEDIYDEIQARRSSFSQDASKAISYFGDGAFLAALSLALYGSGELFKERSLRKTGLLCLESLAISGVLVAGFKFIMGRARPQSGEGSQSFHPFSFRANHTSLPSGHACSAWAVATTIAGQTENAGLKILSYGLATTVAFSRVHDRKHWPADVFLGSALGYFVGKKICDLNRENPAETFAILFQMTGGTRAISFSYRF